MLLPKRISQFYILVKYKTFIAKKQFIHKPVVEGWFMR